MQPPPEAHDGSTARKRPWYRLHLSTWLMLMPVAGLVAIVMVPWRRLLVNAGGTMCPNVNTVGLGPTAHRLISHNSSLGAFSEPGTLRPKFGATAAIA